MTLPEPWGLTAMRNAKAVWALEQGALLQRHVGVYVGVLLLRYALLLCAGRCGARLDGCRYLGIDVEHLVESRGLQWVCDRTVMVHDEGQVAIGGFLRGEDFHKDVQPNRSEKRNRSQVDDQVARNTVDHPGQLFPQGRCGEQVNFPDHDTQDRARAAVT